MPDETNMPTRQKECARKCGATVTEELLRVPSKFHAKGFMELYSSPWGNSDDCPDCRMRIAQAAAHAEEGARMEENRKRLMEMLGGPQPVAEFTLARAHQLFGPEKKEALLIARNFNSHADNLFIYGPCGTGKTHLAVAIALDQLEHGRSVAYFTPPSLSREFRRRLDADKEERYLRYLCEVDVCVLDDLGTGKTTEFVLEKLQEIIDGRKRRYKNGLVVTSNLYFDELAVAFKDRLPDRLHGMCRELFMGGNSYRTLEQRA